MCKGDRDGFYESFLIFMTKTGFHFSEFHLKTCSVLKEMDEIFVFIFAMFSITHDIHRVWELNLLCSILLP